MKLTPVHATSHLVARINYFAPTTRRARVGLAPSLLAERLRRAKHYLATSGCACQPQSVGTREALQSDTATPTDRHWPSDSPPDETERIVEVVELEPIQLMSGNVLDVWS